MTTHDPALLWAAERANLSYDRFVDGLTRETIARIRGAYFRQNGTTILMPAVKNTPPAANVASDDSMAADVEAVQAAEQAAVPLSPADPETTLRAAFQANMHTLLYMVSAWKYKRFLATLNVSTNAEKNLLEKIVREEIRGATMENGNRLTHFLWWLEGQ